MVDLPVLEKIFTGEHALLGASNDTRMANGMSTDSTLVMRSMR